MKRDEKGPEIEMSRMPLTPKKEGIITPLLYNAGYSSAYLYSQEEGLPSPILILLP